MDSFLESLHSGIVKYYNYLSKMGYTKMCDPIQLLVGSYIEDLSTGIYKEYFDLDDSTKSDALRVISCISNNCFLSE